MPNGDIRRVEVITGVARRRYWPAHEKLRIIEESLVPGESVSAVARRNGVAPNLLFRWRWLMDEDEPSTWGNRGSESPRGRFKISEGGCSPIRWK